MQGKGSVVLSKDNSMLKEQYLLRIEEGLTTAIETARVMGLPEAELAEIFHNLLRATDVPGA